jgi:effector-binding domain-containing protein
MSDKCELKERLPPHTLSIRTRAAVQELPEVFHKAYHDIVQYMEELGEKPIGPAYAAYYNMDMQNLDIEMGFIVKRKFPAKENISLGKIPEGRYASYVHTGSYSEIEPAYNFLSKWINDNGYEVKGVSYEYYLNDPDTAPPDELKTEILFPLK